MNRVVTFLFLVFWWGNAFAQTDVWEGRVVDAQTKEPIPFANVVVRGSGQGAVTDAEGRFRIQYNQPTGWFDVSFLGYQSKAYRFDATTSRFLFIALEPASEELDEVVLQAEDVELKRRENPAHRLLRGIWEARKNQSKSTDLLYFDRYEKTAFSMVNLGLEFEGKLFLDPLKVVEDYVDTLHGSTLLPVLLTESFYRCKGFPDGVIQREEFVHNATSGFGDNSGLEQFWEALYQPYEFNSNSIFLFKKNFVSPVSQLGLLTYKYYLTDSAQVGGRTHYTIAFIPQRKYELTFRGELVVEDGTFEIVSYDLFMSEEVNLNFVEGLQLVYRSKILEQDSMNIPTRAVQEKSMEVMFKPLDSDRVPAMIGKRSVQFSNFSSAPPAAKAAQFKLDSLRPIPLSDREAGIVTMIDSLQNIRRFNTYVDLIAFLASGYYETDWGWDVGPLLQTASYNDIEGVRLAFGGRTYRSRNDRVRLYLQAAYGFKDERWKGRALLKGLLPVDRRFEWGVGYRFDMEQLGQRRSSKATQTNNALSSLLSRYPFDKLSMVREYQGYFEPELAPNLKFRLSAVHRSILNAGTLDFSFRDPGSASTSNYQSQITTSELSAELRFEPGRKFLNRGVDLLSVYTGNPSFKLVYTRAFPDLFDANYDFHKIYASYDQPFNIPFLGRSILLAEAGKTFGVVPYPLLDIAPGNPTYTYSRYQYNLMDFFEFVSDAYVGIHYEHHFLGAFLNKMPIMRRLQWREVISFHGLIGTVNPQSLSLHLDNEVQFAVPNTGYYEVSAGIENIFKFLRVEAVWRLSQRDLPTAIPFGIRVDVGINF